MDIGDGVRVRSAYEGTWVTGFEIADIIDGGFVIRRLSDGRLLPAPTGPEDVRPLAPDDGWYTSGGTRNSRTT